MKREGNTMNDEPPFDDRDLDLYNLYDRRRLSERIGELIDAHPDASERGKSGIRIGRPVAPGELFEEWVLLEPGAPHYDEPLTVFYDHVYGSGPFDVPRHEPQTLLEPKIWLGEIRREELRRRQ
jgi:hypothetical protein